MDLLGQLHPQIVHTPIALLIFSAFFAILGRLFDREWVRKTSVLLLVFGFLGAFVAQRSGEITHEGPEKKQGVPEDAIDGHARWAQFTVWAAGAAVAAVVVASRLSGGAASAVSLLALLLQIAAAILVGITGKEGGELVFEHGANVRLGGQLVKDPAGGRMARGGAAVRGASDSLGTPPPAAGGDAKPDGTR